METKDSVLAVLSKLCSQNRRLVKSIKISYDDYEELIWNLHEKARFWNITHNQIDYRNRITIYGIEITHD